MKRLNRSQTLGLTLSALQLVGGISNNGALPCLQSPTSLGKRNARCKDGPPTVESHDNSLSMIVKHSPDTYFLDVFNTCALPEALGEMRQLF